MEICPLAGTVYQALPLFEGHLRAELEAGFETWGQTFFYYTASGPVFWYQNAWLEPQRIHFDSIKQAATLLRSMQRNWAGAIFTQFRRAALIQDSLPPISSRPKPFPWVLPNADMGAWTLLDAHTLVASKRCSSPFPSGNITFIEDTVNPPSRAYLKLYEALVLARKWPQPGERCLDAGASPGGWTWVLSRLGASVLAVDRAPLDERLMAEPLVQFIAHDAFTVKPADIGPVDWLFCDVVCYPARLFPWIQAWLESGLCRNFVCTLKMQGTPERDTMLRFAGIPGSLLLHLHHNKHELTWIKVEEGC
ncbi:SAM-dependent methyltransferase [Breznakiellaceae bacterium SP9]